MTEEDVRIVVGALVPRIRAAVLREIEIAILKALAAYSERLATLEARPPTPGPPGEKGDPGAPGAPGRDGLDGKAGLTYCGVYIDGRAYDRGDCVTWDGSLWHCNGGEDGIPITTKPGGGLKGWTLAVKRGQNGRDARDRV